MIDLRPISWLKGALKDFEAFPTDVQLDVKTALTIAARGGKVDTAKPFRGVDGGVFEISIAAMPTVSSMPFSSARRFG
jgi:phage-related protein